MDYYNHRCPVCEKPFEKDSEIVVCPECGTPHHRECYEQETYCHFQDKHQEGFDYKKEYSSEKHKEHKASDRTAPPPSGGTGIVACENCGTFNIAGSKTCTNCGSELPESENKYNAYDRHTEESTPPPFTGQNQTQNGQPFGGFAFDPMGGLKPETEVGGGITVGETAKFVKNNTPFYTRMFHQIKIFGRSRFSFVGFIFHGGWMLYRKMYKLGAFITAIMALLIISQLYIGTFYSDMLTRLSEITSNASVYSANEALSNLKEFFLTLDTEEMIATGIYFFSSFGQLAVRIICGLLGNRWYYKHSIKHISDIKTKAGSKEAADSALQTKGGVNSALAVSLFISYMVLSFLPYFF